MNIPTQTKEKKKLRGWRAQAGGGYDHQFFNTEKLDALEEKETNWQLYQQSPEEYLKNSDAKQKPPQFTPKDQRLKESLLREGFSTWSKKEFFTFIRMCEMFGRANLAKINEALPNKTLKDIEEYAAAFWENWRDKIENGHKYVERIEKGEAEIEKQKSIDDAIESKFAYAFKEVLATG